MRTPAPSPVSESQPQAPRCARLTRICKPLQDNVVRGLAFDVDNKAKTAGVVFIRGIVQTLRLSEVGSAYRLGTLGLLEVGRGNKLQYSGIRYIFVKSKLGSFTIRFAYDMLSPV